MTKEEKRLYDIAYRAKNKDKYRERNKKWRAEHPERIKEIHTNWRKENKERIRGYAYKTKYSLTLSQRKEMLVGQGGKCAICDKEESQCRKPFVVDHDHKTGKVRGLLCFKCNTGLGQLGDNTESLMRALNYLANNSNK